MVNIAIDGPAGAGKSTVARLVAEKLGYIYIDTGALYRTVAVNALRNGVKTDDVAAVIAILPSTRVELGFSGTFQRVYLNGEDVSEEIRLPEVSLAASNVSAIPEVRHFLLNLQRDIAAENNCIMDGRDIGTVILPNAKYKFFLTATPYIRAQRRYAELKEKGIETDFDVLYKEIEQRDYQDSHREVDPLRQSGDAVLIDSSALTINEVVDKIVSIVTER